MIDVILISHGSFADGLRDAVEIILGPQEHLKALGLYPGDTIDVFAEKLNKLIDSCEKPQNVLILADLRNGTPFNAALMLCIQRECHCITAANLPMVLAVLSSRDELEMPELIQLALKSTRDGLIDSETLKQKGE